jgi:LysM repeat protein
MKNWLLIVITFISLSVFAQPETAQTEMINGKKHYVHFVQEGNTLYGIHKLYNVSVDEILKANPGAEKGLVVGQKIVIPVQLKTVSHEVAAKETLFGISKKYGVTVQSIIDGNPGVENGLKVGQKLLINGVDPNIAGETVVVSNPIKENTVSTVKDTTAIAAPKYKVSFSDTIIMHEVLDHETLYSISKRFMVPVEDLQKLNNLKSTKLKPGDTLKIPVKKEKVEQVKIRPIVPVEKRKVDSTLLFPRQDVYKIALLLPFNLDKSEGSSEYITTLATEYYMGAQIAMDSLERLGLKAKLYVFDSKNDTTSMKKILLKPEFAGMDLVFGPLFSDKADIVARWCKENNARMICPVSVNSTILKNNPYVYAAVASDVTLMKGLAEYTLKNNSSDQVILIKSSNEKDLAMYESFRSTFNTAKFTGTRPKLTEATLENFTSFMKKGVKVVLVFPTNERSLANKFINSLNGVAGKYNASNLFVYGTKEWMNYDEIKAQYKNKFHYTFSSPSDLNYKYNQTEKLHLKYRSKYNSDMTKFAVQGFDVTYNFCAEFLLNKNVDKGVMTDFEMKQKSLDSGFENQNCFILQQIDYELINVGEK